MKVYIAHPIDYAERTDHASRWFHHLDGYEVYCPFCEYRPGEPIATTMVRNMAALAAADRLVAVLDAWTFTFGTPVEVWHKAVALEQARRVCLIHPARPGLFVKHLEQAGVTVVQSALEAMAWLAQR